MKWESCRGRKNFTGLQSMCMLEGTEKDDGVLVHWGNQDGERKKIKESEG